MMDKFLDYDIDDSDHRPPSLRDGINIDALCDHMEGVLDAIYVTGNTSALENSLEELCAQLSIRYKRSPIMIESCEQKSRHLAALKKLGQILR